MLDFLFGLVFITIFITISWGSILYVRDEQALWEDRRDYNKMNKSIHEVEKNDSSKIR